MERTANKLKYARRKRRSRKVRRKVMGTAGRPRLSVYRSLTNIYAQLIDDDAGRTVACASTREKDLKETSPNGGNVGAATLVGRRIAEKAKAAGVSRVVFDRAGFKYHGRVKALADAAREAGLEF